MSGKNIILALGLIGGSVFAVKKISGSSSNEQNFGGGGSSGGSTLLSGFPQGVSGVGATGSDTKKGSNTYITNYNTDIPDEQTFIIKDERGDDTTKKEDNISDGSFTTSTGVKGETFTTKKGTSIVAVDTSTGSGDIFADAVSVSKQASSTGSAFVTKKEAQQIKDYESKSTASKISSWVRRWF